MKWHRIFWLGLWLAGAVAPEGVHAALTPEKLYQKVLPSIMTLEVESQSGERFIGSAVLALADDVALTAGTSSPMLVRFGPSSPTANA